MTLVASIDPAPVPALPWRRSMAMAMACQAAIVLPAILVGAVAGELRRDIGVDKAQIGVALGVADAVGAVLSIPVGRLSQRLGGPWASKLGGFAAAASLFGVAAWGRDLASLLPFMAIVGLGLGIVQPATDLLLVRSIPAERYGVAFGLKMAFSGPGVGFIAGLLLPALVLWIGWRGAFTFFGLCVAALALRPAGARIHTRVRTHHTGGGDVSVRPLVVLSAAVGLGALAQSAFVAFAVVAALDAGLSYGAAGAILSISCMAGIATRLLVGVLADRYPTWALTTIAGMFTVASGCCS